VGADESDFSLESRGFFGDTLSLVGRAGISTLETLENAAEFFNLDDDPKSMASKLREFEIFKPDFEEAMDEGWLQDTWAGSIPQAMESAGPSLAVAGMGFLTGAAVTPIFPLAGGVIGAALASLGIMGTAEYQNTYESAIEMGKSEEEAKSVAWQTGVIEGLGESAASVIGLGFGKLPANMAIRGLTKFVRRPLGESLDALTKVSMKDFATSLGQTYTAEQLTEFAQAFGQTRALREADMTDQGMVESLAKTIIPTLFMTGGFQMATTGLNMNEKRKLRAGLKSDSEVKRAEALNAITHMLAVEDQGLAEKFHIFAREQIKAGAVDFNMDFAGFADELITAHEAKVAPSPLASQISATDVLTGRISEDTVMNIMEKDLQSQNVVKKNDIMSQFMGLAGARLASTEEVAQADQEILQELEAELVVARGKVYKADGTKRARVSAKAEADLAELEQEYNDATAKLTTGGITTGILRPTVSAPTGRAEGVTKGMLKGQIPKTGIKKGISEQLEKPEDVEIAPEEEVLVGMRQRREALNKTIRERQDALTPEATGILVDQIVQLDQEILQMERALNLAPRKETAPTREELLAKEPGTLTDREQRQAYEERDRIDSELADPNLSLEDRTRLMGEYYHLGILGQIPEGVGQITEEELTEQALAATPEEGVTPEYSTLVYELTAKQESIVQEMDDNNLDKFERAQIRWSQANTNYNQAKEVGNKNMMRIAGEYREAAENTMKLMLARGGDPTARKAVAPDSLLQSRQQALAVYKILRDAVTTRFGKDRRPFTGTGMRGATQASKLDVKEAETLGQLELETKEGTVRTKEITVIGDKIGETGIDGLTDEELVTIHNYYEELVGKLPSEREFTLPQQKAMIREFGLMIGQEALGEQLGFGTEIGLEDATRQLLEAAKEEGGLSSSDFYKELGDILGGMTEVKYSTLLEQDKTITERKVDLPNEVIEWFHDEAMAVGNYRSTGYVGHPRGIEGQVFYVFKQAADEYVVFQGDYDANDGFQGERAGNTAPLYEDANGDPVIFKSRVAAAEAAAEYARGLGSTEWIKFKDQNGIVEYKISPEGTDSVYMILSATNEVSKNKWVVYKDGEVFMNLTPKGKETTNFSGSQGQVKARVEELAGFTTSGTTAINRANKAREEAFKEKQELWGKKHTGKAPEMLAG
jgi:hypothetical protein